MLIIPPLLKCQEYMPSRFSLERKKAKFAGLSRGSKIERRKEKTTTRKVFLNAAKFVHNSLGIPGKGSQTQKQQPSKRAKLFTGETTTTTTRGAVLQKEVVELRRGFAEKNINWTNRLQIFLEIYMQQINAANPNFLGVPHKTHNFTLG